MINQFNWLDLGNLIINELFGNVWLFFLFVSLLFAWFSVKYNVSSDVLIGLFVLFGFSVAFYFYAQLWVLVVGILFSFTVYGLLAKFIGR